MILLDTEIEQWLLENLGTGEQVLKGVAGVRVGNKADSNAGWGGTQHSTFFLCSSCFLPGTPGQAVHICISLSSWYPPCRALDPALSLMMFISSFGTGLYEEAEALPLNVAPAHSLLNNAISLVAFWLLCPEKDTQTRSVERILRLTTLGRQNGGKNDKGS